MFFITPGPAKLISLLFYKAEELNGYPWQKIQSMFFISQKSPYFIRKLWTNLRLLTSDFSFVELSIPKR